MTFFLYGLICLLRRDHDYSREVIVNENRTRNYCKCGQMIAFDWSAMGGYKKAMNTLDESIRKYRWENEL